jgi:hypothetical protein
VRIFEVILVLNIGDYATAKDIEIIRSLADKVAAFTADPVNDERRDQWKKINSLKGERPMLLVETGGCIDEVIPVSTLVCEADWARGMERGLRNTIFCNEVVKDDHVMEPRFCYGRVVNATDFGMPVVQHRGDNAEHLGSYVWDAPLKDLAEDVKKLRFREYTFDLDATNLQKQLLEETVGDIMPVVNKNGYWWTMGMTWHAICLMGLQEFMMAMYDQPEGLHALMSFLRDEHMNGLDWFESNGLLTPNNEDDYIGSGSVGYTDELPQKDYVPGQPARLKDMWVLSESQETVGVSTPMFEEFVFPYQQPLVERFGLSYYGCCEPVHERWDVIKRFTNLRKVSVSPWCNEELIAGYMGKDYVYCRKPNPTLISVDTWDEELIRKDLRKTLTITKGMNVELSMKDVHTVCDQPWRLGRWVEIAREVIDEVWG